MTNPVPVLELEQHYNHAVAELEPFDACAWLGRPASGPGVYATPADLLMGLARWRIPRALVSHTMGESHDALLGNQALGRALSELSGLNGVMTLLPEGFEDFEDIETNIDTCLNRGMRAARIFPKSHRYSMRVPTMPRLLEALERRGVPLFIQIGQSSWDEIGSLARSRSKLAIFVEGIGHHEYLNMRGALPWLIESPNLLVPTCNQFLSGGLELLVKKLGVRRVLFASNQPLGSPAAAMGPLVFSELPLQTRRRIAHENLDDLLAAVGHGGYFA